MTIDARLDSQLADVVAVARRRFAEERASEVPTLAGFVSPIPPDGRRVLSEWLHSGEYDLAVAAVVAGDPDLADQ